jgi:hypothetical protein
LSDGASDEDLLRAFVGTRAQDYYLAYFARARARGYAPIAWHWPALFFGILWLAYRRLYPWALALFAAPYIAGFVAALAEQAWPGSGAPLLWTIVLGLLGVWLPLYANALYYRHAIGAIAAARTRHPGDSDAQRAWLATRGGALPLLPFVVLALAFLLLSLAGVAPA